MSHDFWFYIDSLRDLCRKHHAHVDMSIHGDLSYEFARYTFTAKVGGQPFISGRGLSDVAAVKDAINDLQVACDKFGFDFDEWVQS